jgi:hypothetical protein
MLGPRKGGSPTDPSHGASGRLGQPARVDLIPGEIQRKSRFCSRIPRFVVKNKAPSQRVRPGNSREAARILQSRRPPRSTSDRRFDPRPPAPGRPLTSLAKAHREIAVSIRTLRARATPDLAGQGAPRNRGFNPRPPRAGDPRTSWPRRSAKSRFQSALPAPGARIPTTAGTARIVRLRKKQFPDHSARSTSYRIFSDLKSLPSRRRGSGPWASVTGCAASTYNPTSMNSSSASTVDAPGTQHTDPCSASPRCSSPVPTRYSSHRKQRHKAFSGFAPKRLKTLFFFRGCT